MRCTDIVLDMFLIMCNNKHERRSESEICLVKVRPRRHQITLRWNLLESSVFLVFIYKTFGF
jgi:hypothetical protein